LLSKSNNTIYYNGDFDPEELLKALKLKQVFPNINLFCYTKEDYLESKSKEVISNSRLHKLNNIDLLELEEIKKCLLLDKNAEKNIDNIKSFMKKVQEKI